MSSRDSQASSEFDPYSVDPTEGQQCPDHGHVNVSVGNPGTPTATAGGLQQTRASGDNNKSPRNNYTMR